MIAVRRETWLLVIGDLLLFGASLWIALAARAFVVPSPLYFFAHLEVFIYVFLVSLLVFYVAGLYERQARLVKRVIGMRILGAQIGNTIFALILFFLIPGPLEPKTVLGLYLLVSVFLVSCWRFFIAPYISVGTPTKAVLIATGAEVDELVTALKQPRKYSLEVFDYINTATASAEEITARVNAALNAGVSLFVLDNSTRGQSGVMPLYRALGANVSVVDFCALYEDIFDRVPLDHIDDAWIVENLPKRRAAYDAGKGIVDRVFAVVVLILVAPLLLLAILAISLSGGNAFISHERIGKGGRHFKIVKLRTMLFDDHGDPAAQKENRVTPLGAFLRKTRIDELPQLWNVFRGDLSFVGPRPELPKIAEVYEREIPYYNARHLVTPGLSGWAQIWDQDPPRGPADVARTRRKLSFDLYYLKHRSPGIDMAITLKTLRALLVLSGS